MNTVVPRQRGPIARFFIGLWTAMNFTRRLVMNLVFFALVLLVLGILAHDDTPAALQSRTTLVLAPKGRLVEQDPRDPLRRILASADDDASKQVVQLRDLLAVIDAAAKDPAIERVLLDVDDLTPSGFASLHEVGAALQRLRASGKQVVAFSQGMTQGQYYLAAQANEVYLDPAGYGLLLQGLSSYRPYFREGLQDKLGVDFRLFKVGQYKSAAEPYVRDDASPAAKEADLFWMNDVWQRYIGDIAGARKQSPEAVKSGIDTMADGITRAQGDLAQFALQQKLVDGLKTRDQVDDLLAQRGVADDNSDDGFREVDYDAYLRRVHRLLPALPGSSQVAVVVAEGEIVPGKQSQGTIGGESTSDLLRTARDDDAIKAVVLRVNSPGGEVFSSEQIRREVDALKKDGKPVVVSMGDVAASGGYWISMDADRIYADPSTITGSIGIFGLIPNFSRALGKIGVHTDGVGTEPLAGAEDPTRPMDPGFATIIQQVIEKGYRDFTGGVAAARHKPVADVDAIAQGRVWTGAQAKERGLVDAFGGLQDAIDDAAARAKLGKRGEYGVKYVERDASPFAQLFGGGVQSRIGVMLLQRSTLLHGLAEGLVPHADDALRQVEAQLRPTGGAPVRAMAHCFCGGVIR